MAEMHDTAFLRTTNQRNFALVDDTSHVHVNSQPMQFCFSWRYKLKYIVW